MTTPRPSRTRWVILALLLSISIITYIDRVNISVTAYQMMPAFGLANLQFVETLCRHLAGNHEYRGQPRWDPVPYLDPLAGRTAGMASHAGVRSGDCAARRAHVVEDQARRGPAIPVSEGPGWARHWARLRATLIDSSEAGRFLGGDWP